MPLLWFLIFLGFVVTLESPKDLDSPLVPFNQELAALLNGLNVRRVIQRELKSPPTVSLYKMAMGEALRIPQREEFYQFFFSACPEIHVEEMSKAISALASADRRTALVMMVLGGTYGRDMMYMSGWSRMVKVLNVLTNGKLQEAVEIMLIYNQIFRPPGKFGNETSSLMVGMEQSIASMESLPRNKAFERIMSDLKVMGRLQNELRDPLSSNPYWLAAQLALRTQMTDILVFYKLFFRAIPKVPIDTLVSRISQLERPYRRPALFMLVLAGAYNRDTGNLEGWFSMVRILRRLAAAKEENSRSLLKYLNSLIQTEVKEYDIS
jgi:hypothetical protein